MSPQTTDSDCPTVWFAVWARARTLGDYARATEAAERLRELGVIVRPARRSDDTGTRRSGTVRSQRA